MRRVVLPRQDPQGLPSPVAATMISALPFFHCRQTLTDGFISMPAIECVFGSLRAFCVHESSHFALCLDTECVGGRIGSFCVQLIVHRVPNSSCPTPAGHFFILSSGSERDHSSISFLSLPKTTEFNPKLAAKGNKRRPHPFRCRSLRAKVGSSPKPHQRKQRVDRDNVKRLRLSLRSKTRCACVCRLRSKTRQNKEF